MSYFAFTYRDGVRHVITGPNYASIREAMTHIPGDPISVTRLDYLPVGYKPDLKLAENWYLYT